RRSAVLIEELTDRDDSLLLGLLGLHRVERRREARELGTRGIERAPDAHRGGDAAQHGCRSAEHGESLRADLGLAALECMRAVLRRLEHVGERRVVLHPRDATHRAYAAPG